MCPNNEKKYKISHLVGVVIHRTDQAISYFIFKPK